MNCFLQVSCKKCCLTFHNDQSLRSHVDKDHVSFKSFDSKLDHFVAETFFLIHQRYHKTSFSQLTVSVFFLLSLISKWDKSFDLKNIFYRWQSQFKYRASQTMETCSAFEWCLKWHPKWGGDWIWWPKSHSGGQTSFQDLLDASIKKPLGKNQHECLVGQNYIIKCKTAGIFICEKYAYSLNYKSGNMTSTRLNTNS